MPSNTPQTYTKGIKALNRIRVSPLETIRDAKDGSIHDLSAIATYGAHKLPSQLHSRIFDAVKPSLLKKMPKLDPHNHDLSRVTRVRIDFCDPIPVCFQIIDELASTHFFDSKKRQSLLAVLWPDIFRWMLSLHEFIAIIEEYPNEGGSSYLYVLGIRYMFRAISRCDPLSKSVFGDEDVFRFAARLWMDPGNSPGNAENAAIALHSFNHCSPATVEYIDAFEAAFGDPDEVSERAVELLRSAMENHAEEQDVGAHIDVMRVFSDGMNPLSTCIRGALLSNDAVQLVMKALHRVISSSQELVSPEDSETAKRYHTITSCVMFLEVVLNDSDSLRWAYIAFTHGLLEAIFALKHMASSLEKTSKEVVEVIIEILPRFLVAKSVINAACSAMSKLPSCSKGVQLGQNWDAFSSVLLERTIINELLSLDYEPERLYCDNVDCSTVDRYKAFKKCEGCEIVMYCSRACQRSAWRSESQAAHKEECSELLNDTEPSFLKRRNKNLLTKIACMSIRANLQQLRRRAAKEYPNVPFSHLAIEVDLTHPFERDCIDFSLLTEAPSESESESDSGESHLIDMHVRACVQTRVERGDECATALRISHLGALYVEQMALAVYLDKSKGVRDARVDDTKRMAAFVRNKALQSGRSVWDMGLVKDAVEEIIKGLR